ncbi:MAG: hypothetical protein Salg2KO_04790 [Salibacteraceae bacterium]
MSLGGANLTLSADGMSAFHNPALMSQSEQIRVTASSVVMGAGVQHGWLSGLLPMPKSTSAFGLNLNYLSTGAMEVRTEFQPNGTGELFYSTQMAAGLAYAKTLSDRFSFGINLKYINERLAQYTNHTAAADLGFLYSTDVRDLKFGIVVKNFGGNSALNGDYLAVDFNRNGVSLDQYTVPTVFRIGASIKPIDQETQSLMVALQLEHPNDNSENIRIGLEYEYRELLYLRTGYKINVEGERLPTFGVGFRPRFGRNIMLVNYGINITQYLGTIHAFGLDIGLNIKDRE